MEDNRFLEVAWQIGRRLCRDAIWSGKKCNWVGPSMEHLGAEWKTIRRAYGTDLYSGTAGIGFFLSHLYARTKDEIIRTTALGCFEQAVANAGQTARAARIGFYTGWSGMIAALQSCSPLLEIEGFSREMSGMLDTLHHCDLNEGGIDILAGCAGAIPLFLSQPERNGGEDVQTAKKIADHLIARAQRTEKGWSWNTLDPKSDSPSRNLTGFSHGTAGIAWAFLELFSITADKKYQDAARHAFDYERAWFSPAYDNWPDLRNFDGRQPSDAALYASVAWCHGAPGIGLSRVRAFDLLRDEACRQEAEVAIRTTSNMLSHSLQGNPVNFSLCHGLAGNAELLLMAASSLHKEEWLTMARQTGYAGIEQYERSSCWSCGIVGAGETPGLMLGLSGIGYFYLRLFDLAHTPSILLPVPATLN